MALSNVERCQELSQLVGIPIAAEEMAEVAERFASLMRELERLHDLDLDGIEPVTIFPDEEG